MSASPLASTTTRGRTRRTPLFVAISTDATRPSSTSTPNANACRSTSTPASRDEHVPHALQRLRVVRDARAGAVGVRSLERQPRSAQPRDDLVRDAGDDLARRRSRRVEGVEGVEHGGRRAAEEAEAVDEQRARAAARRRDRPPSSRPSLLRSRARRRRCSSVQEYAPMSRSAMAEVARLYYVRDLTQQQIAERLGVSRFKVLRLLEQARSEGVVRFEIDEPVPVRDDLSRALEERFGLATGARRRERRRCARPRRCSPASCRPRDVLGVSWGETLASLVKHLPPAEARCPSCRSAARSRGWCLAPARRRWRRSTRPGRGGRFHPLQAPAVADAACAAPRRSPTTEIFDRVTVALVGIGARTDGAGHILVHVFDDDGRIVSARAFDPLSASRSCGARRSSPPRGGRQKRRAVAGALRTGLLDVLVTDARLRAVRAAMKTAVVTGSRGGIGSATVAAFEARRLRGARRRRRRRRSRASSGSTRSSARTGSAAAASATGRSTTCTDEGWDAVLDANLKSVFLYAKQRDPAAARATAAARSSPSRRCSASSAATRTSPRTRTRRRRPG